MRMPTLFGSRLAFVLFVVAMLSYFALIYLRGGIRGLAINGVIFCACFVAGRLVGKARKGA